MIKNSFKKKDLFQLVHLRSSKLEKECIIATKKYFKNTIKIFELTKVLTIKKKL